MIRNRFRKPTVNAADATQAGVPKLIHIIWIGEKDFPYQDNFRTWKKHNPDYQIQLWTDKNLPVLHNQWIYDALADQPLALRADLLRLELLAQYGGIYTDADSWCTQPIDPLIDGLPLFGMTGNKGNVQNATLGTVRDHPAYRLMVEGAGARYLRLAYQKRNTTEKYEVFDIFGTRYITPVLRSFPDFTQIDRGAVKGSRRLIVVEGLDKINEAYIVHANATTWKKPDSDNRLTLTPACPERQSG
ncbi:glycosyltransferase family 32 protein [Streptomyces yerevanensis]|uniref:glycosyltransferase family 32 protein n=1 Tax=Streptomyces yerevanensis TaxID=66378 RepID=UPI00068A0EA9|nr:glycosyltransferase [Streptomyces yerevanensis]